MTTAQSLQERLGPILLAPGVRRSQVLVYITIVCSAISMSQFMAIIQPYVFTELLRIPLSQQGKLAGNLAAIQQVAVLILVPLFGALSDRLGRRFFLIIAVVGMTLATAVYPLATGLFSLYLMRFLFGAATTAHTAGGAPMIMDLPDNNSRGRFLSLMLISQMLFTSVAVSFVGSRLPKWLENSGVEHMAAGRYTFWFIALVGLVGCAFAIFGLKKDVDLPPRAASVKHELRGVVASMGEVIAYARINRRFRILLIASFVLRADVAVVASFMSLWVVSAAGKSGISTADAMLAFGNMQVFSHGLHAVLPILFGFVADRVNRLKLLLISLGLVTLSFGSTIFVTDVMGWGLYVVIALMSISDSLQSVSSQALLGQEAPPHLRGASYGVFALLGVLSVIIVSLVCGYLFDAVGYNAPFLLIAILSFIFLLISSWMLRRPDPVAALA